MKQPTMGAYRGVLGAGCSCSLEREGLENEVLYPPKQCCFDVKSINTDSSVGPPVQPVRSWFNRSDPGSIGSILVQSISSLINQTGSEP